jgi:hypothetical protein
MDAFWVRTLLMALVHTTITTKIFGYRIEHKGWHQQEGRVYSSIVLTASFSHVILLVCLIQRSLSGKSWQLHFIHLLSLKFFNFTGGNTATSYPGTVISYLLILFRFKGQANSPNATLGNPEAYFPDYPRSIQATLAENKSQKTPTP